MLKFAYLIKKLRFISTIHDLLFSQIYSLSGDVHGTKYARENIKTNLSKFYLKSDNMVF